MTVIALLKMKANKNDRQFFTPNNIPFPSFSTYFTRSFAYTYLWIDLYSVGIMNRGAAMQLGQLPVKCALLPTEPPTHQAQLHWRECMFCHDYSLSQQELHKFQALRDEANLAFQTNPRHDLLRMIHAEYFTQGTPQDLQGKEWLRLGFQGVRPETDLRGGGVLSLQLILRFLQRHVALVREMQVDKGGFFFAITAINVAFFMKKFFHLADFLVAGRDQEVYCSRRALKNFCRLLANREQAYFDLHEIFLVHFYTRIWKSAEQPNKPTLLRFNQLFDILTAKIKKTFEGAEFETFQEFKQRWEAVLQE